MLVAAIAGGIDSREGLRAQGMAEAEEARAFNAWGGLIAELAGFDPMLLGYRKADNPCLPPERLRGAFNLAGIVRPAILLRGRVAGR